MMSDLIALEPGRLPWQPSSDAQLGEVFDRYDRPLIGIVAQGGHNFLFACIAGRVDDWNVWAYTMLESDELDLLESSSDFEGALRGVGSGKPFVVAVASEESGLVEVTTVEHSDELPGAALTLLESVGQGPVRGISSPWRASTNSSAQAWQALPEGLRASVRRFEQGWGEVQHRNEAAHVS